jgi:hypothetical protein
MLIQVELGDKLERIAKCLPKRVVYYELKKHRPWLDEGSSKLGSKETSQIAVVAGSKRNKWDNT